MSDFKDLYKNQANLVQQQSLRRAKLLEEQRLRRENKFTHQRDIKPLKPSQNDNKRHLHREFDYKDNLMLSEWMMEAPEDLEDFLLMPCPKGTRVTLSNEKTKQHQCCRLYYKNGAALLEFRSNLPQNTILDCIYDKTSKTIFILDVIVYDSRPYLNCDTAFRRFWIKSKFLEDDIRIIDGEDEGKGMKFELLESYDMADSHLVYTCLQTYPMFEQTEIDGFLFYHKDADYSIGETPLVLWLFPFMIEEVLPMFRVHPTYNNLKPSGYTNYLDYIKLFNEQLRKKKNRGSHGSKGRNDSMEVENTQTNEESFEAVSEMQKMIDLERFGEFE